MSTDRRAETTQQQPTDHHQPSAPAAGTWRYGNTPPLREPTRWPRSLAY